MVRARMIEQLAGLMSEAAVVGDLEAARIANEAIGRLLGQGRSGAEDAEVVDLASRRSRDE